MALEWSGLEVISNNLVTYYFGSDLVLSLAVVVIFMLVLSGSGIELRYAFIYMLPLLAAYVIGGVFGVNYWILNLAIIGAGFIYTTAIVRLMS